LVTVKFRLLNQFGASAMFGNPDEIEIQLPYESTDALVKRMTKGEVRILNDVKGEGEFDITGFELQGMPIGRGQNFTATVKNGSKVRHAFFQKLLHVGAVDVGGNLRKVIEK